jgi:hypothetical protein
MKPYFPLTAIFFISFILLSGRCKKDKLPDPVLPPATQEGKNTIGFKVNGNIWLPYYECGFGSDPCGEISVNYGPPNTFDNFFSYQVARRVTGSRSSLTVISLSPITYIGNKFDSVNIEFRTGNGTNLGTGYSKSYTGNPGTFEITKIDPVSKIISGIFSFRLYNNSGGTDSIDITDGRFDFKMNSCICR